jgi:hypothetical protein
MQAQINPLNEQVLQVDILNVQTARRNQVKIIVCLSLAKFMLVCFVKCDVARL